MIGVLLIISGMYLIIGIIRIRNFLENHTTDDAMNTKTMLLHACAFGLYLIGTIAYYLSYMLYYLFPAIFTVLYEDIAMAREYVNFVALFLLCLILWDMGSSEEKNDLKASV